MCSAHTVSTHTQPAEAVFTIFLWSSPQGKGFSILLWVWGSGVFAMACSGQHTFPQDFTCAKLPPFVHTVLLRSRHSGVSAREAAQRVKMLLLGTVSQSAARLALRELLTGVLLDHIGPHTGLELAVLLSKTVSAWSSCPSLWIMETTGKHHHPWLPIGP